MKRTFIGSLIFLISSLGFSFSASAAPVGSTQTITQGHFDTGVTYNHVFQEDLHSKDGDSDVKEKVSGSDQVYATIGYGMFQNERYGIDFTGKLGAGNIKVKSSIDGDTEEDNFSMGFLWGVASKMVYHFDQPVSMAFHAQYNEWYPDLDNIRSNGDVVSGVDSTKNLRVQDFQAAILFNAYFDTKKQNGLSYNVYAGPSFKWLNLSGAKVTYQGVESDFVSSRTKHICGAVVGMDIMALSDALTLNIEGRFISEYALTLSIHYQF